MLEFLQILLATPLGVVLAFYLKIVSKTCSYEIGPSAFSPSTILVGFHPDYYLLMVLMDKPRNQVNDRVWLGYHGFFSYIPTLWFWHTNLKVFRFKKKSAERPLKQVIRFLKENPNLPYAQGADSGRPYFRIKSTLATLLKTTDRSVVFGRLEVSSFIKIFEHQLPLPFCHISCRFSEPVTAESLQMLSDEAATALLQSRADAF